MNEGFLRKAGADNGLARGRLLAIAEDLAEELKKDAMERLAPYLENEQQVHLPLEDAVSVSVQEDERGARITLTGEWEKFQDLELKNEKQGAVLGAALAASGPPALWALKRLLEQN